MDKEQGIDFELIKVGLSDLQLERLPESVTKLRGSWSKGSGEAGAWTVPGARGKAFRGCTGRGICLSLGPLSGL